MDLEETLRVIKSTLALPALETLVASFLGCLYRTAFEPTLPLGAVGCRALALMGSGSAATATPGYFNTGLFQAAFTSSKVLALSIYRYTP